MADALELLLLKAKDDGASPEIDRVKGKLGDAKKGADDAGKSGQAMGGRFAAGANVAKLAIAGMVAGLGVLAVKGVMAASDLSEAQNKVSVVFGESADAIEAFAANAAQSMGLARTEALSAAGTFGNLFVAMGIGQETAVDMSKGILTLAADLGSFNNIPVTDALEKLRAGLVGETEPLRTLGVNLTAATVETRALEMGFKKVGGELSASAKAQAAYSLILEQTKTAQGDFANTSTGMANSMKIIQASFGDIVAEIGGALLPIVAPMISAFAQGLPGAFAATKEALTPVFEGLGLVVEVIQALTSGQGFDALYEKMNTMMGLDMAGWLAGPIDAFANFRSGIEENGDAIGGFIQTLEPDLSGAIKNLQALWEAVWPHLQEVLGAAWKVMGVVVEGAWDAISTVVKVGLKLLSGDWEGAWTAMGDFFGRTAERIGEALRVLLTEALPAVLKGAWEMVKAIGGGIAEAILEGLKAAWGSISGWLGEQLKGLKDAVARANPMLGLGMQVGEAVAGMAGGGGISRLQAFGVPSFNPYEPMTPGGGGSLGRDFLEPYAGANAREQRMMSLWNDTSRSWLDKFKLSTEFDNADIMAGHAARQGAERRALLQNAGYDPDRSIDAQVQGFQQLERASQDRLYWENVRRANKRRNQEMQAAEGRLKVALGEDANITTGAMLQGDYENGGNDTPEKFGDLLQGILRDRGEKAAMSYLDRFRQDRAAEGDLSSWLRQNGAAGAVGELVALLRTLRHTGVVIDPRALAGYERKTTRDSRFFELTGAAYG